MLRWHRTVEYGELVEYYKGLISLRKCLPGLCDKSPDAAARITCGRIHGEGVVSFLVDNQDVRPSLWEELFIVYNASSEEQRIEMPEQGGFWEVLADGDEADCRRRAEITENSILVAAHSGMLLGKRKE